MKGAIIFCLAGAALAQLRGIVPEEFISARPGPPVAARPAYRKSNSSPPVKAASSFAQVGFTIWRLRPPLAADNTVRLLVHEKGDRKEWIPERVESSAGLSVGDRVRLSFELPRQGYIYVVDREDYGNGNLSDPVLIFPTQRTRGGDNRVGPGRLFDIPAQNDSPNYLTVQKSRPDQRGELLTIVVATHPLPGITVAPEAQPLDKSIVAGWEKRWLQHSESFELKGGAGRPWTLAEQRAALLAGSPLTPKDSPPQSVFRTSAPAGIPLVVHVLLRYSTER